MVLLVLGFLSGMFASAVVVWWTSVWQWVPAIAFGAVLAGYFTVIAWREHKNMAAAVLKMVIFIGISYAAYYISLQDAGWILGTSGSAFADFTMYNSSAAESSLFVACFVGSCVGIFILSLGIRLLFLKFDFLRGTVLFALCSAALGSVIAVGFENFGFLPQLLFPLWHTAVAGMVGYLEKSAEAESVGNE